MSTRFGGHEEVQDKVQYKRRRVVCICIHCCELCFCSGAPPNCLLHSSLVQSRSVPMYPSTNYNASCVPAAVDDYKNHQQQQQQQKHYLPKLLFLHEFIVLKWNKFRLLYRHQGFVVSTSCTSTPLLLLLDWSALINCTFAIGWRSIYLIVTG